MAVFNHSHQNSATMSPIRLIALTTLAIIAFVGNSLLCRVALKDTGILRFWAGLHW